MKIEDAKMQLIDLKREAIYKMDKEDKEDIFKKDYEAIETILKYIEKLKKKTKNNGGVGNDTKN